MSHINEINFRNVGRVSYPASKPSDPHNIVGKESRPTIRCRVSFLVNGLQPNYFPSYMKRSFNSALLVFHDDVIKRIHVFGRSDLDFFFR